MIVTIFDYGAGNLHSLAKAIVGPDVEVRIEPDPAEAVNTDVLILPGVGAFSAAAERLAPGLTEMQSALKNGLPCLGICLGMQLLLDESEEGPGAGLGVIHGKVRKLKAARIPQIGWNKIEACAERVEGGSVSVSTASAGGACPVRSTGMRGPSEQNLPQPSLPAIAYFANSYVCNPIDADSVIAWTEHEGDRFASAIQLGNTIGVQFHPEKSSTSGVQFIKEFIANAGNTGR